MERSRPGSPGCAGTSTDDTVGDWPAYATEPVEIVPPDPAWVGRAAREIVALRPVLAPWLTDDVHHVGSTAVPGLAAKPIVDLMAGVRDLVEVLEVDAAVAALGYELVPPEFDGRPWRRAYIKPRHGRRYAHLHLVEPTHARWRQTLAFRDRLRADRDARGAYARLKRDLAAAHAYDREAYTAAKDAFIRDALRRSAVPDVC